MHPAPSATKYLHHVNRRSFLNIVLSETKKTLDFVSSCALFFRVFVYCAGTIAVFFITFTIDVTDNFLFNTTHKVSLGIFVVPLIIYFTGTYLTMLPGYIVGALAVTPKKYSIPIIIMTRKDLFLNVIPSVGQDQGAEHPLI